MRAVGSIVAMILLVSACSDDAGETAATSTAPAVTTASTSSAVLPSTTILAPSTSRSEDSSTLGDGGCGAEITGVVGIETPAGALQPTDLRVPDAAMHFPTFEGLSDAERVAGRLFVVTYEGAGRVDEQVGDVRGVFAVGEECYVRELASTDDTVIALVCFGSSSDCTAVSIDAVTEEVTVTTELEGHQSITVRDDYLYTINEDMLNVYDLDFVPRWSASVGDRIVEGTRGHIWLTSWVEPGAELLDPATGESTGRTDLVSGQLYSIDDAVLSLFDPLSQQFLLIGDDLGIRAQYGGTGFGQIAAVEDGSHVVTQSPSTGDRMAVDRFDVTTGELQPLFDFSGEPVSRSGPTPIRVIAIEDDVLWFIDEAGVGSVSIG